MSNWRTLSRSLGAVRGPHGHGPKPFLNKPGQAQGTHGGKAKGGRIGLQYGGPPNRGRTNLLEQLGRVEAERSNPNRRAEISRVHGELNRGYAVGGAVRRLARGLRGRKGKGKDFKTHGRDVPTMAAKGGRIGLKHGGKPWGTGPKPGTHEFMMQDLHKKRKGKAIGGVIKSVIKAGKKAGKKISDAARKQDLADSMKRFEHAGPHEGEVITKRILGKRTKKGDRTKAAVKDAMAAKPGAGKPHAAGGRIGKAVGGSMDPKHHKPKPKWPPRDWQKYKPRQWPQQKPPQLRKSQKERREELRKKARKSGGHSKIVFADEWKHIDPGLQKGLFKKEGGRIGFRKGGTDKKWIQKAVNPKHKGFCTPMTKKTCTPRRKALARTFKKMGRERKAKG